MLKLLLAVAISIFSANSAFAQTATFISVGQTIITVPMPKGYVDGRVKAPELNNHFKTMVAADATSFKTSMYRASDVAKFYQSGDGRSDAYYGIQVLKDEAANVTQADFDQLRQRLRSNQQEMNATLSPDLKKHAEILNKTNALTYGVKTDLKFGEVVPLGVSEDTPKSFIYSMIATITDNADKNPEPKIMVSVAGFQYIKQKVIMFMFYKKLVTSDDISASQRNVQSFLRAVERANQ